MKTALATVTGNAFLVVGTLVLATAALLVGWIPPRGHLVFAVARLWSRGLLAAIVVGPALPPTGLERRLLRAWYQEHYGNGAFFAFVQPGMTKVVQAAGRQRQAWPCSAVAISSCVSRQARAMA